MGADLILAGIYAKRKITVYEEKSSCHNHKNTKRDKQHFRFSYNKTFSRLVSLSHNRFTRSVRKRQRENKEDVRGTTKDPCLLLLLSLFSRLCWQNYLDLQSFYFHLLVLIGLAWFTESFRSVRHFCLSFSNRSLDWCFELPLQTDSASELEYLSTAFSVNSELCALLIWIGVGYRQFWVVPMKNDM